MFKHSARPTHRMYVMCLLGISGLFCLSIFNAGAVQSVYYPKAESASDVRAKYPLDLLQLALQKSGEDYVLVERPILMLQARRNLLLAQGKLIDIVWTVTTKETEEKLLPIRIPIDRGLIGWRLFFIRSADEPLFANVANVNWLASLRAVQGHDWPDTKVLRDDGLAISTGVSYDSIINMLLLGHVQYFPRSISEIWPELEANAKYPITVEKHLLLHYPSAIYFFVNKQNTQLAIAIEKGLRASIADGSMQKLFNAYYQAAIDRANIKQRKIINIANPNLPDATPVNVPELWFNPLS